MHSQEWLCHEMPGWRREELLRLSNDAGLAPQLCSIFLPANFGRRESRTSWRFAPGRWKENHNEIEECIDSLSDNEHLRKQVGH